MIERMARMARSATPAYVGGIVPPDAGLYDLMLVAAAGREAPAVGEPLAPVTVGAVSASEVRLFAEAYLESGEVQFSSEEIRQLHRLSGGHAGYLQRAAFHLYRAHQEPGYNWRAAFAREARDQPIIGAALPPEAFQGEPGEGSEHIIAEASHDTHNLPPLLRWMSGPGSLLPALAPFVLALVVLQFSGSWIAALIILLLGYLFVSRLP
ncbi:MAG: hypothetical protein HC822_18740 [Oscillochloris sp.]|nr:hypothetical protein [Oscillochloris sp.]